MLLLPGPGVELLFAIAPCLTLFDIIGRLRSSGNDCLCLCAARKVDCGFSNPHDVFAPMFEIEQYEGGREALDMDGW